jgi:hypothetical protein
MVKMSTQSQNLWNSMDVIGLKSILFLNLEKNNDLKKRRNINIKTMVNHLVKTIQWAGLYPFGHHCLDFVRKPRRGLKRSQISD